MTLSSTFEWPDGLRAAVSLSFDDARTSQIDEGMSLLKELGVRATFYVNPGGVRARLDGWRKAYLEGHEIGNHTRHHPCSETYEWSREHAIENYTLSQMAEELIGCNNDVHELIGTRPQTFAYPCGQTFVGRGADQTSYIPLIADHFLAGRGVGAETNDPALCDLACLKAASFDERSLSDVAQLIERALDERSWLIFFGHEIGEKPGNMVTEPRHLTELCRYLTDPKRGIWLDTVESVATQVTKKR
jgi:peptidoglycan/xylan/chitin deacetylase (PgdA/CDA1 family)